MKSTLLTIQNLTITYANKREPAVRDFFMDLSKGEVLGLFGRSGCGKSSIAWTIMGLIDRLDGKAQGTIMYEGIDLLHMSKIEKSSTYWKKISIVPQTSMSALNPSYTIQKTLEETMMVHNPSLNATERKKRCAELMDMVYLPYRVLRSYPHELSGGMRQRVSIALAIMLKPQFLLLDEATTGLDVIVEADILHTLKRIQREENMAMLLISHDARIQNAFCDRRIDM